MVKKQMRLDISTGFVYCAMYHYLSKKDPTLTKNTPKLGQIWTIEIQITPKKRDYLLTNIPTETLKSLARKYLHREIESIQRTNNPQICHVVIRLKMEEEEKITFLAALATRTKKHVKRRNAQITKAKK